MTLRKKSARKNQKNIKRQFSLDNSIVSLLRDDIQWIYTCKSGVNNDSNQTIMQNIKSIENYFDGLFFNGVLINSSIDTRIPKQDLQHDQPGVVDDTSLYSCFRMKSLQTNDGPQENVYEQDVILSNMCIWFEESMATTTTEPSENNFRKWKLKHIVDIMPQDSNDSNTKSVVVHKGVGVVALEGIEANELVIKVPFSLMISIANPRSLDNNGNSSISDSSALMSILEKWKDNESVQLALLLLHHKFVLGCDESFFGKYIVALPKDGSFNVPLYWDSSVFQYLISVKSSSSGAGGGMMSLYRQAANSIRASLGLYCRYLQHIDNPLGDRYVYSWKEFKWALCIVMTRQNAIPIPESIDATSLASTSNLPLASASPAPVTLALVPVWDMINHSDFHEPCGSGDSDCSSSGANVTESECVSFESINATPGPNAMTTHFNVISGCLEFRSQTSFAADAEISMCYGTRNNLELMLYSGFCNRSNRFETVVCTFAMPVDVGGDPLVRLRDSVYRMCKKGLEDALESTHYDGSPSSLALDIDKGIICFTVTLCPIPFPTVSNCVQLVPFYLLLSLVVMAIQEKSEAAALMRAQPLSSTALVTHLLIGSSVTLAYAIQWSIDTLHSIRQHEYGAESVVGERLDSNNGALYMCDVYRLAKIDILDRHIMNLRLLFETHVKPTLSEEILADFTS